MKLPLRLDAFPEIKIDQIVAGNTRLLRHCLEVGDDVNTHADGELLLESGRIRVWSALHFFKIVFAFHGAWWG